MQTTKEETRTIYIAKVAWSADNKWYDTDLHCFYKEEDAKAYVEAKQNLIYDGKNIDYSHYYYEAIMLWNNSIIGDLKNE